MMMMMMVIVIFLSVCWKIKKCHTHTGQAHKLARLSNAINENIRPPVASLCVCDMIHNSESTNKPARRWLAN